MPDTRPTIDTILNEAVEIAQTEHRAEYLGRVCAGDEQLRGQVEKLIADHFRAGAFLEQPAAGLAATEARAISERPGMMIGPYKLLEQIGEGGFGVVFMAEQQQPVRRKVALKVLKPGMDTRQVIARFEAERQALALMDHPNIAKVLDAGETTSARPYFVMELVRGIPITQYCDESQLTARERLTLFVSVCQAVQHAHQKGIIHRDLKPSNVLVTQHDGTPVVKVIDFGVAKATGYQLTEKTLFTGFAQMIGTPLYMSPEQAALSGLDIDTRSDIYSLGVLLYELLTGTTPLTMDRLKKAAFDEIRRLIREEEPQRPSTRVHTLGASASTVSAQRKTEPHKLQQLLRNELDWIVMRALEKDRTRRYDTTTGLAKDVQRYLADEPVEACPPSAAYRLSKFIRRNKVAFSTGSLVAASLLIGLVASSWLAIVARQSSLSAAKSLATAVGAKKLADQKTAEALAAQESLRETLYASEMNLVTAAFEGNQYTRAMELLNAQRPRAGQTDLRGFEWHYWQRKLEHGRLSTISIPRLYQLPTHDNAPGVPRRSAPVYFADGGARLAAILAQPENQQQTLQYGLEVWDSQSGQVRLPFVAVPGMSLRNVRNRLDTGLLFSVSGDGSRLAVATKDRISIRDAAEANEIASWQTPAELWHLHLSPEGDRVAMVSLNAARSIQIWNCQTGELMQTLPKQSYSVERVVWSPDGSKLLSEGTSRSDAQPRVSPGGNESTSYQTSHHLVLLDANSGAVIWERNSDAAVRAWSPDGQLLAVTDFDRSGRPTDPLRHTVEFWNAMTGQTRLILGQRADTHLLAFSPDGRLFAAADAANDIRVTEIRVTPGVASTDEPPIFDLTLRAPGDRLSALAFSADGRRLQAVAGTSVITWDATVRDSDLVGPLPIKRPYRNGSFISSPVSQAAFNADATQVELTSWGLHTVTSLWDIARKQELRAPVEITHFEPLAFSRDSRHVAGVSASSIRNPLLSIVEASSGKPARQISLGNPPDYAPTKFSGARAQFHPSRTQLAATLVPLPGSRSLSHVPQVRVWDTETGEDIWSAELAAQTAKLLGYSPDGDTLVVGAIESHDRGTVLFYDSSTGKLQRSVPVPAVPLYVDFPHQRFAASTATDVILYDLQSAAEQLRLRGHGGIDRHALSPDGKRLVLVRWPRTLDGESEVSFWSLETGKRVLTLSRKSSVVDLAFSADGYKLFSVTGAGRGGKPIEVWDATPLPTP